MTDKRYDIVVVGGGINGVGVAQAGAAAGHSVLLLEKSALAAGTSSSSSSQTGRSASSEPGQHAERMG